MFPVGSSLDVLPCAWLSRGMTSAGTCRRFHRCIPSVAVAIIFQPQQVAIEALAGHGQRCFDATVAVVEAVDVHRRQADLGEVTRGRETGIVGTGAAAFIVGEVLHLLLQRLQGIDRSRDPGTHGVVVVCGQGDRREDGHDRYQYQQQAAADDRGQGATGELLLRRRQDPSRRLGGIGRGRRQYRRLRRRRGHRFRFRLGLLGRRSNVQRRHDQAQLVDNGAQRLPLRQAVAPDQGVQGDLVVSEQLDQLFRRQRALLPVAFCMEPLAHGDAPECAMPQVYGQ